MISIALSPEQISQAPPEVRRWLEQQIVGLLNASRARPAVQPPERHLVGCDLATARGILTLINEILPVVSVFFELAREPAVATAQGLRALRLDEMARHARLQGPEQVVACLRAIDEALQRVCGAPDALLTALDGAGHCLVADTTARSILALWQELVAAGGVAPPHPVADAAPYAGGVAGQPPYDTGAPSGAAEGQATG